MYRLVKHELIVNSDSHDAVLVGPHGSVAPVFSVDAATPHAAAGVRIVGAAPGVRGSGPTIIASSSSDNENLVLRAKGTGRVLIPGSLDVSGIIYNPAPSMARAIDSTFVFSAATRGGTFGITSVVSTPVSITLPTAAVALGGMWRFVVSAKPARTISLSLPYIGTASMPRMVGQVIFADAVSACDSFVSDGFNTIKIGTTAVPGDWIEVYGVTASLIGFRASSATTSVLGAISTVRV